MTFIKTFLKLFIIIGMVQLLINIVSNDFWTDNVEKVFVFSIVITMAEVGHKRGK